MKRTNIKFIGLLLMNLAFSFLVCCKNSSNEQNPSNSNTQIKEIKAKIKSETAVYIARGFLVFDYDFHHCEPFVTEQTNAWFVDFQPTEENQNCPDVWIDKESGEILKANLEK